MKRLIFLFVMIALIFCGCSETASDVVSTAAEELLNSIVEKIDVDELQNSAEQGVEALVEKFPVLEPLTSREDMREFLKDSGLKLIRKYLESTDTEVQANAEKLGAIIKILSPELTDEVDAVLAE